MVCRFKPIALCIHVMIYIYIIIIFIIEIFNYIYIYLQYVGEVVVSCCDFRCNVVLRLFHDFQA